MANHLYEALLGQGQPNERTFLHLPNGRAITYGALRTGSGRYATLLQSLGVAGGDRVVVQVQKCPDAILLMLACIRLGAVFVPLNTAYTASEVGYFVADAAPRLVVCDPARKQEIEAIVEKKWNDATCLTLGPSGAGRLPAKVHLHSADFDTVARGPDDLAAILYTSGTTGRSKGAMLSHDNLASNAAALRGLWQITEADVLLHALPIYHTHGLFVATNTLMMAGGSMIFLPKFEANAVLEALPRATMMMGVPTFYTRLLADARFTQEAAAHMRVFISGSAPLLADTHSAFEARTGHRILERYGMTETNMITSNPYEGERRPGAVGFALPGVEVRVADRETGAVLPAGEIGVVELTGPNVFKGYWRQPDKTAEAFRADGWFITGDLGQFDADGYLHIVGRGKDLIISGGFNVYPKEIELAIDALPGVIESAVIGVPHPDFGEAVVAVVVPEAGADLSEAAVLAGIADGLAKFKQPKRVVFADDLPRNAMGKVQKAVLREQHAAILG